MQSNKLRLAIRATAAAAILGITSQPAMAQSTAELQAQLDEMQQQIDSMKAQQGSKSGQKGWVIPGTNTTMTVGGYVKLDMIYDFDQDLGDSLFVQGIDTAQDGSKTSFRAHARQSRFNIKTSTPTDIGVAKTTIEGDFFGGGGNEVFSNSNGLRIRHAYGELNGWLAGQTWSNFMQFTAYPSTIDFDGPVGVTFVRQAQLRYTTPVGNGGAASFSVENAETTGFEGTRDAYPDLTARYKWAGNGGGFELGALARSFTSDTADDDAFAYGLMAAGRLNLTDATSVMASVIFGDGIGRYLYTANSNDANDATRSGIGEAYIDQNGDLETVEAYGFNVAVAQQWTPKLSSSLSYGRAEGDNESSDFPNSFETLQSIHFTNFYQVADPVTLGVELSWGDKELANGESADNTRLQMSAQLAF